MKKIIQCFTLILLAFILMIGGAACMRSSDKYPTSGNQSSGADSSTETIAQSDRQIVEAVLNEWYPTWYKELTKDEIVDEADYAMESVAELSGKLFGSITSEEDAMEKAEAAWMEIGWGDDIKDERPHATKFYEKYGVWLVDTFSERYAPDGFNSEGNPYMVPGSGLCAIMRESDGKVLAAWLC